MTDDRQERATAVRIARARHRLTQEDLAQLTGLDQTTISKAELGTARDATYDRIDAAISELDRRVGAEP